VLEFLLYFHQCLVTCCSIVTVPDNCHLSFCATLPTMHARNWLSWPC
jgi:hypothetical protein